MNGLTAKASTFKRESWDEHQQNCRVMKGARFRQELALKRLIPGQSRPLDQSRSGRGWEGDVMVGTALLGTECCRGQSVDAHSMSARREICTYPSTPSYLRIPSSFVLIRTHRTSLSVGRTNYRTSKPLNLPTPPRPHRVLLARSGRANVSSLK